MSWFASVAGQQQQRAQSCYQLEQGPSSDPSSSSSTWRLEHGNGQPSAVEIRGKSAGAATTGRRRSHIIIIYTTGTMRINFEFDITYCS